jgi:hypothetical protein
MRSRWTTVASIAVMLALLATAGLVVPSEDAVDPRVPEDLYGDKRSGPSVNFLNATIERGTNESLFIGLSYLGKDNALSFGSDVTVTLEIYMWAMYGDEVTLDEIPEPLPLFVNESSNTSTSISVLMPNPNDGDEVPNSIMVPTDAYTGYYRVRVTLEWAGNVAKSKGHFSTQEWNDMVEQIRLGENRSGESFLISEAGFTVVPEHFKYVSLPNKVPDLGNFTTPVIRPGETDTYNFTVTNRYDLPMEDVRLEVGFYMWATIEEAKPIDRIDGPPPKVKGSGSSSVDVDLGTIPVGGSKPVTLDISTSEDTPKGTYFVRHRMTFTYDGSEFVMASRGHFSSDRWEGFDYSNLLYQLDTAGIVPDSSFSVKDPVPLWPLATLIGLCVFFGGLAVVFYLAEEHGEDYPRLKRGLQYWSGKWHQRKRLWDQRLDELRGDVDVPLDDEDS